MKAAIKDLMENLRHQERIYQDMRQLAHQQLKAETHSAETELNGDAILNQRAKLVEELQIVTTRGRLIESALTERFALPEFTVKGLTGLVDADSCQLLEQAFSKVGGLLKEIVDLDAQTTELMRSRLTAFKGSRQHTANSAQALQAYRDASQAKKD